MTQVGDLNRFGFRIGPVSDSPQTRNVKIFMGRQQVSWGDALFLPSFVGGLESESKRLTERLNYLEYDVLFAGANLTEIHNSLLHGNAEVFEDENHWERVALFHEFMCLNEPETDVFRAFLIPFFGRLYLTFQCWDDQEKCFLVLGVVDGSEVTPYYLIKTLLDVWEHDEAFRAYFISILSESPFSAFRWETPPITRDTANRPFEFVLLNSPGLARKPDTNSFADYFTSTAGGGVSWLHVRLDSWPKYYGYAPYKQMH